jgi:hypothetical protein
VNLTLGRKSAFETLSHIARASLIAYRAGPMKQSRSVELALLFDRQHCALAH